MTKLTDTQRVILSAASQRTDRLVLPLPKRLKGGAAQKSILPLIKGGLVEEVDANRKLNDPVWRETGDGHAVTLVITDAGLAAMGVESDTDQKAVASAKQPQKVAKPKAKTEAPPARAAAPQDRQPREGTKQSAMIDMLRSKNGATLDEISAATGWQRHTIRGAMAGALKKKLGLEVASTKDEARGRVYRIA